MTGYFERMLTAVSRITPATLLARGAVFLFTLAALVMAIPTFLFGPRPILAAAVLGLVVALAPGSRIVTVVLGLALVGWGAAWLGRLAEISPLQLVAFGSLLYLAHSAATLAALIPYDAVVTPEVFIRWYVRAIAIVAASAVISLALLVGVWALARFNGAAIASLLGLAAAVALVAVGVRMVRARG
ncbi:MAG: hypothetical protein HOV71_23640 [Hamadaea sp.]|nr:hypothetical protein [Hamadaea sp.]NUR51130.1 hypothetical protein [Hamadaea sp.]NUT05748.1 hypothetical protein [Hamadaea sp.]